MMLTSNHLIDNNVHDVFSNNNYTKILKENEVIYKKNMYDLEEFTLKQLGEKYACSVPLKSDVHYVTYFDCINNANHFLLTHLYYFTEE
tara:strand:- start:110 stop:376 length:267 start_codon:yes stop_codon:yes gene_type:complete